MLSILEHARPIVWRVVGGLSRVTRGSTGGVFPLLVVLLVSGCQQGVYTPRTLPPEFAVAPVVDIQRLDLSPLVDSVTRDELIYRGDVLEIKAITGDEDDKSAPWTLRVADDGTLDVPLVGPVPVAGLSLPAAENAIREASLMRRVYRAPKIHVTVKQRRVNRVTVSGAVQKPGTYELPVSSCNLATAVMAAGGFRDTADRVVEIRRLAISDQRVASSVAARGGPDFAQNALAGYQSRPSPVVRSEVTRVDLVSAARSGGNYSLDDGAIINVVDRPERFVHLIGVVGNREIELPHARDMRVLDAVSLSGGPRYSLWIADKIHVIRRVPDSDETVVIKVSIREAKRDGKSNILLQTGDIVSVEENIVTFTLGTLQQLVGIGATTANGLRAIP